MPRVSRRRRNSGSAKARRLAFGSMACSGERFAPGFDQASAMGSSRILVTDFIDSFCISFVFGTKKRDLKVSIFCGNTPCGVARRQCPVDRALDATAVFTCAGIDLNSIALGDEQGYRDLKAGRKFRGLEHFA